MAEIALPLLAAVAVLAAAAGVVIRSARCDHAARRDILADCAGLLSYAERTTTLAGYGALRGVFAGAPAALTPIVEALAFRRLPQLWIAAALKRDGGAGAFEIVRRPTGAEFFAGGAGLPRTVAPPRIWPQDTGVRCDAEGLALLARLEVLLAPALADPRLKAITATPRGVRVVRQAAQGERGAYLLFREARFAEGGVPREQALAALSLAAAIAGALVEGEVDVRDAA